MIKINLLPYWEAQKEEVIKRQIIFISVPLVVFLLVIVILHVQMVSSIGKLEKEVQAAEGQLKILTKITGDLENVKKDKEIYKKKLAIIKKLESSRLDTVLFLDDLTMRVPEGYIWLTALDLRDAPHSEPETTLSLKGIAKNNSAISDFMRNLERSQFIRSVDLISSKQTIISGIKLKEFTLSCNTKIRRISKRGRSGYHAG
jgi:Tfp pilus assembly protein PilN